jgi:hypothetical protein
MGAALTWVRYKAVRAEGVGGSRAREFGCGAPAWQSRRKSAHTASHGTSGKDHRGGGGGGWMGKARWWRKERGGWRCGGAACWGVVRAHWVNSVKKYPGGKIDPGGRFGRGFLHSTASTPHGSSPEHTRTTHTRELTVLQYKTQYKTDKLSMRPQCMRLCAGR